MLAPDNADDEGSIPSYIGATNFNSEWNKFVLLMWKNVRILWSNWEHFVTAVFMPIFFCTMMISLRITLEEAKQPVENYPIVDLPSYWENTMKVIDMRRLSVRVEGSENNPFLPHKTVGYAPDLPSYANVMQLAGTYLKPLDVKSFASCEALKSAITEENLFVGVCFEPCTLDKEGNCIDNEFYHKIGGIYPNHLKYRLIYPFASRIYNDTFIGISWNTNSLYHFINRTDQRNIGKADGGYVGYIREGFAPLQNSISLSYLKLVAVALKKPDFLVPEVKMCRFPSKEFHRDNIIESMDYSISLLIVFGNIYPTLMFISRIVSEKEGKLKIYSKIMGVSTYVHFLGWMVNFLLRALISSFVIVLLLKIKWSQGISILDRSNFFALLLVICVYNITSICFILMMGSFYKSSLSAVSGCAVFWFLSYTPYILTLSDVQNDYSWALSFYTVIFHNTAMGRAFDNILELELFGEGFNFMNFFSTTALTKGLSTGTILFIMLLQCFMYTCICLYVEELMPGNFGLAKRWNFLFTFRKVPLQPAEITKRADSISVGSEGSGGLNTGRPTPFIYEVGGVDSIVIVHLQNVSKTYGEEHVLKNINLQLHDNEITILLGHNGSGKSTLLSMIGGLRSITTGSISIEGFDVSTDQRYACASLGLGMGDTVLYPELTVEDQIRFCCFLKGLEGDAIDDELDYYLKSTKLNDYRLQRTKFLPLGMRQQLAICCALSGQSRVVLLDDPTTHMDLTARTMIYKLLDREKLDRTILVTSTSARVLENIGDRVVVLSNGEMQCDGSPVFIKKMYGHGYRLIVTKGPYCNVDTVTGTVRDFIPSITPLSTLGNEICYTLEESNQDVFDQLTDNLEQNMATLSIVSVTLRPINVDDIFFKLAAANPSHENRTRLVELMNGQSSYPEESKYLKFMDITERLTGLPKLLQNVRALFRQRFIFAYYFKSLHVRRLIYPPLLVYLAFICSSFEYNHRPQSIVEFNLDQYPSSVTLIEKRNIDQPTTLIMNRYKELIFWLGIQHKLDETEGELLSDYYLKKDNALTQRMDQNHHVGVTFANEYIIAWFNNVALHSVPLSLNLVHNAIFRTLYGDQTSIEISLETLNNMDNYMDGLLRVAINTSTILAVNVSVSLCSLWNAVVFLAVRDIRTGYDKVQFLAGVKLPEYWIVNLIYDSFNISWTAVLTTLSILACQYGVVDVDSHIYMWYCVLFFLCGVLVYSFNYAISGWFANPVHAFAVSLSFNLFGIICYCHIVEAFEKDFVNTTKSPYAVYFLFLPLFAFCSALSTVFYSGEFIRICREENIRFTSIHVEYCKAIPNCCRTFEILDLESGIVMELIAIIITIGICWWIIIVRNLDFVCFAKDIPRDDYYAQLQDHKRRHDQMEEDRFGEETSFQEQFAIQRMKNADIKKVPLVCDRLGKNFGKNVVIDRLSLILHRFNCFGLLGVSGSGVTTLLDLIAGFKRPSYGRVLIKGHNIAYNLHLVQQMVGYGRQEMINFPEYTVHDIMKYMCCLHSYPQRHIEDICMNLAKVVGLYPYYNKHLSVLSLGLLNRLNIALAVMGNPKIIILDMAIAGIDSAGKREVWNVLERMQHKGATILTASTSLRDCERYCNRVGFMSNGRLCVIGEPWNLNKLQADSHLLRVKFSRSMTAARTSVSSNYLYAASLNKLTDFIYKQFPNSVLKEHQGNNFLFLIPVRGNSISHIFTTLMRSAYNLNIEDFELSHCSLSQSFIEFWAKDSDQKLNINRFNMGFSVPYIP